MTIIQASLPMPFNARREALIIEFAYHSLLKLDKSGKTQVSPSRPWQEKGQNWKKRTASDLTASSPMPFNARRDVLIIEFAYHCLLKLDKSGKTQERKRSKLEEKDCLWPHGPSAIPDRFTGAVAHFCNFEARPPACAIPPPSSSSASPVRDRPARGTTTRPSLFLQTIHKTDLFI